VLIKWILSGKGNEDQVVIFRNTIITITKSNNRKQERMQDYVCYNPNKKLEEIVFFIDPQHFTPFETDKQRWRFRAFNSSGEVAGYVASVSRGKGAAEIKFLNRKWGSTENKFQVLIIQNLPHFFIGKI